MPVSLDRASSVRTFAAFARPYLEREGVTELAVNLPGEIWVEHEGRWERHEHDGLDLDYLLSFARAAARYAGDDIGADRPILSAELPDGERLQIVQPPACEPGAVSVTIRRPSTEVMSLADLDARGLFDAVGPRGGERGGCARERELLELLEAGRALDFLSLAVRSALTIVVAGRTGSGKTTLMKALAQMIHPDERLVTIEDTHELELPRHGNRVHLFYSSEDRDNPDAQVTPTTLLRSCYRMRPDRILVAELRGSEAREFVSAASSGHAGSITSVHAGSARLAFRRISQMIAEHPASAATPLDAIEEDLREVVDVVVHMDNDPGGALGRHITEIHYEPRGRRAA